ncbi:MAG TPA: HAD-IC family P-type ATPase [Kofleriaceae bacterium]|nr:HAD-IC family P-type ATPase [Kofleriaceae bacterium]
MRRLAVMALSEEPLWHALPAGSAVERLATDIERGLAEPALDELRRRFGPNELPAARQRPLWAVFLGQFRSPLIYLLFGAAAIALALGETKDATVIFIVVVMNSVVGAYQEGRAEHALAALRRLSSQKARVVRGGGEQILDARDLVPGDVLLLAAGDAVTADARLIDGAALQIAEAALTGESLPVAKTPAVVAAESVLADRTNMVYAGTHVTAGRARAVIVATGTATEIGHIASLAEGGGPQQTPLERRVEQFGRSLMFVAVGIFALFVAVGLAAGLPLAEIAMVGISQVVGLIPEGLPVAMTVALAVGVQRMARRRAIVRRLSAVETLGSTTVICTDKTGTLTRNEMTVTALWLVRPGELTVTGSGYAPDGRLLAGDAPVALDAAPDVRRLVEAAILCNDAHVLGPDDRDPRWRTVGDPTEAALVTLAIKAGLAPEALRAAQPRRAEIPFDSAIKMMATQHDTPGGPCVIVKGAAEAVLALCAGVRSGDATIPLDDAGRRAALASAEAMAGRALRVLAVAEVRGAEAGASNAARIDGRAGVDALRGRATLLGLIGQIDPPRAEAGAAVATCLTAGIRPVMVTGDHKITGLAVARTLGIARDGDLAVDGVELAAMTDDDLASRIDRVRVFARVHPAQKLRIVEAYQRRGEVVAMTGDGVNDAPALMRADVGVAMGLTGTDVAKEAAKIVITDDDFGSIVAAVEEGRVVYRNIKKAVLLLMSTSFAEVLVLLGAVMLGYPPPFAAVQILWNNLVTEGVITINLIMDPAEGDEMQKPPTSPREPLITRSIWRRIALMTPTITLVTLGWFTTRLASGVPFEIVRTETFTLLAVCEWFNVLNCLSERRSAFTFDVLRDRWLVGGLVLGNALQVAVIYLPALNHVFHTVPIPPREAFAIGAVASLVLWTEELRKLIARARDRRSAGRPRAAGMTPEVPHAA